jgi:hypothetical protein
MVMSLYPKAQESQRLAQNIVKMLDLGMGTEEINETGRPYNPDGKTYRGTKNKMPTLGPDPAQDAEPLSSLSGSYELDTKPIELDKLRKFLRSKLDLLNDRESQIIISRFGLDGEEPMTKTELASQFNVSPNRIAQIEAKAIRRLQDPAKGGRILRSFLPAISEGSDQLYSARMASIFKDLGDGYFLGNDSYDDDDGFTKKGYTVYYQEGDNQFREVSNVSMSPYSNPPGHVENQIKKIIASDQNNINEDKEDAPFSDLEASYRHPDTNKILAFARQHYPEQPNLQGAFVKFVLRSLKHSEEDSERHEEEIENLNKRVDSIEDTIKDLHSTQNNKKVSESFDYIEEK